jgi:hyperosmotically inducible protein
MRFTKVSLYTAAAVALLTVACAHADKTTGETIDDTNIASKTKTALLGDKTAPGNAINVEVYKGKVLLGGFVGTEEEKAAAIAVAGKVTGVVEVIDGIVVLPGKRSIGQTIDDQTIQAKLKTNLIDEAGGKGMSINTEVRQGEVLMSGFVPDEKYRSRAGEIATAISGVKKVHNYITVKEE